jgi:hypothetical protein
MGSLAFPAARGERRNDLITNSQTRVEMGTSGLVPLEVLTKSNDFADKLVAANDPAQWELTLDLLS